MGSYARVTPGGTVLVQTRFVPPISLGEGERLSYVDYVAWPPVECQFSMRFRTASGTVLLGQWRKDGRMNEAKIEIVGGRVEDVLELRRRMFRRLGIEEVSVLPLLPTELENFRDRLMWLIRWLLYGYRPEEAAEASEA